MINVDGTGLEQITYDPIFDAFPMFSYDGKKLVFGSNRNNRGTHDTNLFVPNGKIDKKLLLMKKIFVLLFYVVFLSFYL